MRILRLVLLALAVFACASAQAPAPKKSTPEAKAATPSVDLIDINSATEEQLRTIPGIGEAYAKKIVAGRPYRAKNDLVQKKILPAGVYDKVKDRLIAKQK
jgi:DNA uptake protein ComE-like DNA-binding protein